MYSEKQLKTKDVSNTAPEVAENEDTAVGEEAAVARRKQIRIRSLYCAQRDHSGLRHIRDSDATSDYCAESIDSYDAAAYSATIEQGAPEHDSWEFCDNRACPIL